MDEPKITLTLEQRKLILQLMNYSYTIPTEYHECVAKAIKKYATRSLSDEAIKRMVEKSQSVANSGFLLRKDSISLFRGKFAEWLACIEYNALKNSGSVIMTIVNPDETSKADLLHFIKVGNEFKAVAGPDIKSGGSSYVFNQWKKVVTSRHDIPMVDFDGILTTEEGLKQLTERERAQFEELCRLYPRKRPIPSMWSSQDELRLRTDYFKAILEIEGSFEYSPETRELLKAALAEKHDQSLPSSDWSEFNRKCKDIFRNFNALPEACKCSDTNSNKRAPTESPQYEADSSNTRPAAKSWHKKIPWKGVAALTVGAVAVGGAMILGNKGAAKKAVEATTNLAKEALGGTHASPRLHRVRGYVRKNGTKVRSYIRGGK